MEKLTTGEKLKKLRGRKTLKEVAFQLGITEAALSNYENGIRVPRDEMKVKIAEYYKRSVKYIFFS